MSATLKKLYTENNNPFNLSLYAGQNSIRNTVTWVYMLEDEYIIPYFRGAELAVTTCIKLPRHPDWLMTLVQKLVEAHASGLIINIGKFITKIPSDVIDYCNEHDFPLFTVPWEIRITEMIQVFCTRIINEQQESIIHDKAMRDALTKRENETEYREVLSKYYDLDGKFTVILIYSRLSTEESSEADITEYLFINQLRRFKTLHDLKKTKMGLISHEHYELMILNNVELSLFPEIRNIILNVYEKAVKAQAVYIGVGNEVQGLSNIHKSYYRARTAMRMAVYRNLPSVSFEEMGFYKILFSVKDDEILSSYSDEILAPLDSLGKKAPEYLELLKVYIQNDRSLEKTAAALFLHRNTVNYRIQKMKTLLNSPLKTVEDLFPFQVALAIRDMEAHTIHKM
ncbi:MAG: PucR family transcriptional regulator ligand-binding domain-containing protein [Lachnospiraceae bacterium]|nr:PucR family transcriptional regulator ligand-binding domain-containing protein [Lachnospiraceae bacterium]